ncbi:hypothetical protein B296_00057728 [Ensete ventricosum]|uniref:Uncharacterized protein n=1 Tax=Ensete ventricosum TaxID=4639 RepID=A0A426XGF2_ENSVE|nr:hypothetical protein B296_00057728 [Ensete ventricosum]
MNTVDFSNKRSERPEDQPENPSECNGTATGAVVKKARVLGSSSSSSQSALKVAFYWHLLSKVDLKHAEIKRLTV